MSLRSHLAALVPSMHLLIKNTPFQQRLLRCRAALETTILLVRQCALRADRCVTGTAFPARTMSIPAGASLQGPPCGSAACIIAAMQNTADPCYAFRMAPRVHTITPVPLSCGARSHQRGTGVPYPTKPAAVCLCAHAFSGRPEACHVSPGSLTRGVTLVARPTVAAGMQLQPQQHSRLSWCSGATVGVGAAEAAPQRGHLRRADLWGAPGQRCPVCAAPRRQHRRRLYRH